MADAITEALDEIRNSQNTLTNPSPTPQPNTGGFWSGLSNWLGWGNNTLDLNTWFEQAFPGRKLSDLTFSEQMQVQNLFKNEQMYNAMDKYAGFGPNLATAKLGFDILGGIGSWVQGNKNLQFAKDQFNWQKDQVAQQNALAWDAYLNRKNSMGRASAAFAGESFTPDNKTSVLDRNK